MLTIGLDADDTLWHNESLYWLTQEKFRQLLAPYHSAEWIDQRLYETELRNLEHFGYGIKGFALSMIETAIDLTEGRVGAGEIGEILGYAKTMLQAPVDLLPGVEEVVQQLASDHQLMLITKGDLFDQESKVARSGLGDYFAKVEIVREKDPSAYRTILQRHGIAPQHFLMVGNSMRSDILPVLSLGGLAAYIPYHITWQHEAAAPPEPTTAGFFHLDAIDQLPALVQVLSGQVSQNPTP
jgi:putative hydrolase of the HAD superfamily